jgi:hypothetical protein
MRLRFDPRGVEGGAGRLGHVINLHLASGFSCGLVGIGDNDGDDLTAMPDSIVSRDVVEGLPSGPGMGFTWSPTFSNVRMSSTPRTSFARSSLKPLFDHEQSRW